MNQTIEDLNPFGAAIFCLKTDTEGVKYD